MKIDTGVLVRSKPVQALARRLGMPDAPELRRGRDLPSGDIALSAPDGSGIVAETLAQLGVPTIPALRDDPEARTPGPDGHDLPPAYAPQLGALIVDATAVRTITGLEDLRAVLRPAVRGLEPSGRVVVVATASAGVEGLEARAVTRSLDGLVRSVAKELRDGATANLVYLEPGTGAQDLVSTLAFLLEGRSAYVDGQSWHVGPRRTSPGRPEVDGDSLAGRIVVVTGAARGIGAQIARTFHREGAVVVAVDVPAAGEALSAIANEVGGTALQLDITVPDAGVRIAEHVASRYGDEARIHAIAHNAGILRDRLLANMDERRWAQVLDVNLAAQLRINQVLLDPALAGGLAYDAHIIASASTSGIAGNRGQTNYGASKAGVIGLVQALSETYADRPLTVNAVAPGFIETDMTATIPPIQRELFRLSNSLHQGGRPGDVAELIVYLADPATSGVNGQVIRVCGQLTAGA
ncbi:3-oxoacyl-[acyl-carrier protein] reductase [Raineyella antarctica]|uniref:3-oxoacyl-[acyl-carrier protein] reductase n=1 Tax=Raineyella antarctica TaxID=1577474 RepID=A0A1G6I4V6_9ACTN|nr:3-oxoacyl-ACP reductase [Raineyella antarctica]SDC01481.1 3-oxoacyl-[acyl-carrier protein] reductase [Raineyella antarctica]